ncbi:virion structural protein_gp100 [Bacillus phage vB_BceM_WH1]|nr:virion structural protein_gp100 [Bacillus phage vB_BceM_WH1]
MTKYNNRTYTSFGGADILATITPLNGKPIVFGELQTVTYSIYRPTSPVYALGRINPKGVVRGQRTIAGTLIFTVFDRHVLKNVMRSYENGATPRDTPYTGSRTDFDFTSEEISLMKKNMKTDELPPFDININFMNEYGNASTLNIYGVHILTEGQTMSIEDMITENTMQYIAMDIDLMDPEGIDDVYTEY